MFRQYISSQIGIRLFVVFDFIVNQSYFTCLSPLLSLPFLASLFQFVQ